MPRDLFAPQQAPAAPRAPAPPRPASRHGAHGCAVCGAWGAFGFRKSGRGGYAVDAFDWLCAAHRRGAEKGEVLS